MYLTLYLILETIGFVEMSFNSEFNFAFDVLYYKDYKIIPYKAE